MASGNKATSHGQKVDLGQNAPVTQEGPGAVASDSLAAESSTFKKDNEISTSEIASRHSEQHKSTSRPHEGSHHISGGSTHAGTAPSYVDSQYTQASGGPHGKNLKEDKSLGTGSNASFTEIGSKDDPARLAEAKLVAQTASSNAGGVGRETAIDRDNQYDTLKTETSA
ncbi:hypothetical protein BKA67DRAFT_661071 [Truncatella angustata]|uniref:Uncharacterized protein n=1 Tax=Truncatella angustata TaxID=152316 RepID=A0A9P8UHS3_9PEZI|nr:uncharacterized protein BKA67DRAFT_661071 [Truncatella angustata]KAH6652324.1 hypothetical protein BKA67DRAFT_661071 [Truncatella angustata]KAH8205123.1 hypothetical protein TruAng_000688 [Truncatella angustata]